MTKFYMDHFTFDELKCPLTGIIRLDPAFEQELAEFRKILDEPMAVTSGCRSPRHNQALVDDPRYSAHPASLHMYANEARNGVDCLAVDIARPNGQYAYRVIRLATERGWSVGVAKTFLHLDRRIDIGLTPAIFSY